MAESRSNSMASEGRVELMLDPEWSGSFPLTDRARRRQVMLGLPLFSNCMSLQALIVTPTNEIVISHGSHNSQDLDESCHHNQAIIKQSARCTIWDENAKEIWSVDSVGHFKGRDNFIYFGFLQ
jgi:hypothetical protein